MKKRIVIHIIISLFIVSFAHAEVRTSFTRNLGLGAVGPDVLALQILLNQDPATMVSTSGLGSPGQETTYFGLKTRNAVIKFQNKYISYSTGAVGPLTRAKLNGLQGNGIKTQTVTPAGSAGSISFSQGVDYPETHDLRLYEVKPYQIQAGATLTVTGDNFGNDGLLHIGDSYSVALSPTNKVGEYQAVVPTSISNSTYEVWVTNSKGSSKRAAVPIHLTVTSNPAATPSINSISPKNITSLGQTITVTGSNFTGAVSVVSSFGLIKNLSSTDGASVTFSPSQFPDQATFQKVVATKPTDALVSVPFYIVTGAGYAQGEFIVQ